MEQEIESLHYYLGDCRKQVGDCRNQVLIEIQKQQKEFQKYSLDLEMLNSKFVVMEKDKEELKSKVEDLRAFIKIKPCLADDKQIQSKIDGITLSLKNISDSIKETKEKAIFLQKDFEKFKIEYLKVPLKGKINQ
ncbi:MAG: hypothetical protein NTX01_05715 [Candidatus Omnitrophica bacterium]|nr:hypothetical protein [Candidatus Omnitrophota bacterium]